ncbi:hypothetical protein RJT34_01348 [Clitoria ternatea]|uniref:Uncharacterized protein n=1 Tax=Clitoria ternatea TaxID=43366 RepID=A0AAN9Q178_CLITE
MDHHRRPNYRVLEEPQQQVVTDWILARRGLRSCYNQNPFFCSNGKRRMKPEPFLTLLVPIINLVIHGVVYFRVVVEDEVGEEQIDGSEVRAVKYLQRSGLIGGEFEVFLVGSGRGIGGEGSRVIGRSIETRSRRIRFLGREEPSLEDHLWRKQTPTSSTIDF